MGLYDEQIKERIEYDDLAFQKACLLMKDSVLGKKEALRSDDKKEVSHRAIHDILKYYHIHEHRHVDDFDSLEEEMDNRLTSNGIIRREVELSGNWYKNGQGPFLAEIKSTGDVVAILPDKFFGLSYYDKQTGKVAKINKKNKDNFDVKAYSFYRAFPQRQLKISDLIAYMYRQITANEIIYVLFLYLLVTLIAMLTPKFTGILYGMVVNVKSVQLLVAVGVFMITATISRIIIDAVKSFVMEKIARKVTVNVEAATMIRILSLPPDFFRQYTSGELSNISGNISSFSSLLINTLISTSLGSLFSLLYITQIFRYAPALVLPSIIIVLITTIFNIICTTANMKRSKKIMEYTAKSAGVGYSLLSGVEKIKLSGSEKRAFAKWAQVYATQASLEYNAPMFLKVSGVINTAITTAGTIVMYFLTLKSGIELSEYIAFLSAYGLFSGAFGGLSSIANQVANIKPSMEMCKPILDAVPEVNEEKEILKNVSGDISIENITFRYDEQSPFIFEDFSLKIKKGQYVAIVGKTGCGKSTIVRLMLGFEKPERGAVSIDGRNLNSVDINSVRRHIGTVIQNGKLFQGTIFENVTVAAPQAGEEEVWRALRIAGLEEDVKRMPMGINTVISEGQGGVSGGQKQRLMIARAIVGKPNVLILDEATAALDNITQKQVSDALSELKCTRIVIAHRLSTIKECDRIVVIDDGKIVQDGTYDELISEDGFFAELVARQKNV